jgi:hypothetical protein
MSAFVKVLAPIIQWKWIGASAVGCHTAPPPSEAASPPLEPEPPSPPPDPEPLLLPDPEPEEPLDDELPELELDPELDPELPEPPESSDALTSELASELGCVDAPGEELHAHHATAQSNAADFVIASITGTFRSRMSCSRGTPSPHCSLRRTRC